MRLAPQAIPCRSATNKKDVQAILGPASRLALMDSADSIKLYRGLGCDRAFTFQTDCGGAATMIFLGKG